MARNHREDHNGRQRGQTTPQDRYRSPMTDQREDAADNWARPAVARQGKRHRRAASLPLNDLQGTGAQQAAGYNWQANGGYFLEDTPSMHIPPLDETNDPGFVTPPDRDWAADPFDQENMPDPPSAGDRSTLVNAMHDGNVTFTPDDRPVIVQPQSMPGPGQETGYAALKAQGAGGSYPTGGQMPLTGTGGGGAPTPGGGMPPVQPGYANTGAAPAGAQPMQGSPMQQEQARAQQTGPRNTGNLIAAEAGRGKPGFGSRPGSPMAVRVILITVLLLVVALVAYGSTLRLERVDVEGNVRFTDDEIRDLAEVHVGDHVLSVINMEDTIRARIRSNPYLLYVNSVRVSPRHMVITVREVDEAAYVNYCGITYVLDDRGYVLRKNDEGQPIPGAIRVEGLTVKNGVPGSMLSVSNPDSLALYCAMMREMTVMLLAPRVTEMYVGDLNNVFMGTAEGYSVHLGRGDDLHAKLRVSFEAVDALEAAQASGEMTPCTGTVDVSVPEDGRFIPENNGRTGIAYFSVNDACYTIDSRGIVITETLNAGWMAGLIRVDGLDPATDGYGKVQVGAKVPVLYEDKLTVYSIITMEMEEKGVTGQAAAINLMDAGRLTLTTKDDYTIVLGDTGDLKRKVQTGFMALDDLKRKQEEGTVRPGRAVIDISDPGRPRLLEAE